jgi:hypothetical protein
MAAPRERDSERRCPECGCGIDALPSERWDGVFYEGHDEDCSRYGTRVGQVGQRERVRGRFYIERDCDGWTVVDSDSGGCLSWNTKREAEEAARFARAYVRRWGRIDFQSLPLSLDEVPNSPAVHPVPYMRFNGERG